MTEIDVDELKAFAAHLLEKGGFQAEHARDSAKVLTWADARGTASHGVLRIPRYVEMVEKGIINAGASMRDEKQDGVITILDAGKMPGASAMITTMNRAITNAESFGLGWCSVKNITHAGAVGFYALQAVEREMLGIVISASKPLMAYHGASESGLSTNPISIAVPKSRDPLLLDMSTSTVALGKIMHARNAAKSIPAEWGIDETGAPTTDPTQVKTLTPLGGPKGSGLSMMIEILASVLVSNPAISEALKGGKSAMNGVAIAIDIKRFTDTDLFASHIEELVARIKQLPTATGVETILMPGERGFLQQAQSQKEGITLASGTVDRLTELANHLSVEPPAGW